MQVSLGYGRGYGRIVRFRASPSYSHCAPGEGNYLQKGLPGMRILVRFERARF